MSLYSTSILLAERILPKEAYTYLDQKCIPISIVYTLIYQGRWIDQLFYEMARIGPHTILSYDYPETANMVTLKMASQQLRSFLITCSFRGLLPIYWKSTTLTSEC